MTHQMKLEKLTSAPAPPTAPSATWASVPELDDGPGSGSFSMAADQTTGEKKIN